MQEAYTHHRKCTLLPNALKPNPQGILDHTHTHTHTNIFCFILFFSPITNKGTNPQ